MNRFRYFPTLVPFRPTNQWTAVNHPTAATTEVDFVPSADIVEEEKHFTVWVALPGVKKSDVNLALEKDELIISGTTAQRVTDKQTWIRKGVPAGHFRKVFQLSDGIDHEGIQAEFEDGLLKVTVPKAPQLQKRSITIN